MAFASQFHPFCNFLLGRQHAALVAYTFGNKWFQIHNIDNLRKCRRADCHLPLRLRLMQYLILRTAKGRPYDIILYVAMRADCHLPLRLRLMQYRVYDMDILRSLRHPPVK